MNFTKLELLKKEHIPGNGGKKLHIKYLLAVDGGSFLNSVKEGDLITYPYEYHRMIVNDFEKSSEGLTFKNKDIIEKQRAVMGYLIKKIGSNLLSGKSIMNVSLPINIFDVRSHLEV